MAECELCPRAANSPTCRSDALAAVAFYAVLGGYSDDVPMRRFHQPDLGLASPVAGGEAGGGVGAVGVGGEASGRARISVTIRIPPPGEAEAVGTEGVLKRGSRGVSRKGRLSGARASPAGVARGDDDSGTRSAAGSALRSCRSGLSPRLRPRPPRRPRRRRRDSLLSSFSADAFAGASPWAVGGT